MADFYHLHVHSEYSIGDGLFNPKLWAKAFYEEGFKGGALTDHGTMSGSLVFYHAMKALKLNPILGCEFYFNPNPLTKTSDNRKSTHLVLLAKNYDGWQNLLRLQKLSYVDGFYFKPRIGWDWLEKHHENLICTSACIGGMLGIECKDLSPVIRASKYERLLKIFGDDFYVEFQGHDEDLQREINGHLMSIHSSVKPVITNDCHFILPEHHSVQMVIKKNAYSNKEAAESYAAYKSCYLKSKKEIFLMFKKHQELPLKFVAEGMNNTSEIAEKCRVEIPTRVYLPTFSKKLDSSDVFKKLTTKRLASFFKDDLVFSYGTKKGYIERFAKEYKTMTKYKLQDYFLIVWDIIRFAKKRGIYVGIGRGSSAGSLICYLLGITKVNPLQYKLIFERMLNDNRCENGELPDVDLDFESARRHEIKEYVVRKYGQDHVCEIGTYGRLKLKSSIIDFGKQFGFKHYDLLNITTNLSLDKEDQQSLEAAMKDSPQLTYFMDSNPEYKFAVESLNGQIKSQSIHPAGVLICSEKIEEVTPVKTQKSAKTKDRVIVTQSEDKIVIGQGMVKMDFLGLKEYDIFKSVIENSPCKFTHETYIDEIHKIAMNKDSKVWDMFRVGRTEAVFQFSSEGMQNLLIDMKPDCMNDLVAAVALYRPGCIENGWHIQYCKRKNGAEEAVPMHPLVTDLMADTYQVPVFQEQFMEIFNIIGDIPLTDGDTIRSALGKKDLDKLKTFKKQFVKNASKKMDEDEAVELWGKLEKAASYSFNRSHSAVYGLVAFISQYFKVTYPAHFWAAVLGFDARSNDMEKLTKNRKAAIEMDVGIKNPHINKSGLDFIVDDSIPFGDSIQWSFSGIKGVGPKTAEEIVRNQPYTCFEDFYNRVHKAKVKWDAMLALCYTGTFDEWMDRKETIRLLYALKNEKGKEKKICPDLTDNHMLFEFYTYMGFFEQKLKDFYDGFSKDSHGDYHCFTEEEIVGCEIGAPVIVGGMISEVHSMRTRKGDPMGKAMLVDLDENIELTFFPKFWIANRSQIQKGSICEIEGEKSDYNGKKNLINVTNIKIISEKK